MPRLAFALISVVAHVAAQETRITDLLEKEYVDEGCEAAGWGPFPTATATTLTAEAYARAHGASGCKCGMLYGLAHSSLSHEDDVAAMSRAAQGPTPCSGGTAAGFPCDGVDLIAHLPLSAFQTNTGKAPAAANDLWGWTHKKREFVIWGVSEGHFFVEVTDSTPKVLAFVPSTDDRSSVWHDVKVLGDFAYMVADASPDHGMQIFDLKRLLSIDEYQVLTPDKTYFGTDKYPVGMTHNLAVNEDSNFVYILGANNGCVGGLHAVDVSNPLKPKFAACFSGASTVHDAQCVIYEGPDKRYRGREICFCFNQDHVAILDVSDKSDIAILKRLDYDAVSFTHQGWLSSDQKYLVFGDEFDEQYGRVPKTRTLVMNVEDLENPGDIQEYLGSTTATDHNLYVAKHKKDDYIYEANYRAGLQILKVKDYATADFVEVGRFDTYPENDSSDFAGAWSVYPYFKSGLVAVSSIEEGLFLVKRSESSRRLRGTLV